MFKNLSHFSLYGVVLLTSILGIYALIHYAGLHFESTHQLGTAPQAVGTKDNYNPLFLTLCSLLTVIVVSRVMGAGFQFIGQPQVIGEVVGGILLGPSLLATLAPGLVEIWIPSKSLPILSVIAQIGVLLYMFVVGLELDLSGLRRAGKAALAISHASIVVPFLLGVSLAIFIYKSHAPEGIAFEGFALFMGVSMSVTAFPVLARILSDAGLQRTPLGNLALTCAAIDDVTAWCLLAVVVGVLQSTMTSAWLTIGLTLAYVLSMFFLVRPAFARIIKYFERSKAPISETSMAIIMVSLLVSAVTTELIGIHALFGGFLLGAIIPSESRIAADLSTRLEDLVRIFFLPAFFAFTGMRTQVGLLTEASDWWLLGIVLGVATLGKFGGAYVAARFSGIPKRESAAIGILMNTRGLVELIVLNVGLDLGVLTPRMFTILVLMAIITTLATSPILRLLKVRNVGHWGFSVP